MYAKGITSRDLGRETSEVDTAPMPKSRSSEPTVEEEDAVKESCT